MEKRYQIFVSSTYSDLRDERQEVMQALLELDCIPAGMELFPATDDEIWTLIKRVIDESDYYVIILAGRYGTLHPSGKSYTQMEYEYAVAQGKPIIAFLHENPASLAVDKAEIDPDLRAKLDAFRTLVRSRMCKSWTSASNLGSVVSRSLVALIKARPAMGWIRAESSVIREFGIGGERRDVMQWDEYMERIEWLTQLLREPVDAGLFTPDAIMGISNGGLIVADLLWRQLFSATPIVALWARRRKVVESEYWFFDNAHNNPMLRTFRENVSRAHPTAASTFLLTDDFFGTGNTARQAIGYLKRELGANTRILYTPLVALRPENFVSIEPHLPYAFTDTAGNLIFAIQKEEYVRRMRTTAAWYPYRKEIRRF